MLPSEYSQTRAGETGEKRIKEILMLHKACNHLYGKLFQNIYLGHGEHTNELDFVSITSRGIFVVEVKNWSGQIQGTLDDEKWIQHKTFETIYPKNPIKQNRNHANKLKSVLGNTSKVFPYFPITVFVKNNAPKIQSDELVNLVGLTSFLDRFGRDINIPEKDVEIVCASLDAYIRECGVTKAQHLRNIAKFRE